MNYYNFKEDPIANGPFVWAYQAMELSINLLEHDFVFADRSLADLLKQQAKLEEHVQMARDNVELNKKIKAGYVAGLAKIFAAMTPEERNQLKALKGDK